MTAQTHDEFRASVREEFRDAMIRRYLGHGVKTRLVRVLINGTVQTKGSPRWDICPNVWATVGTADEIMTNIEAILELEPVAFHGAHHARRFTVKHMVAPAHEDRDEGAGRARLI